MKEITFSQAIDGYLLYANSRRLSEHTVADYRYTFRRLQEFLEPEDPPLNQITLDVIEAFFAGLTGLSKKTVVNYHTGLSALWTWAVKRRVADEHVVRQFDPPKPGRPLIEVFTEEELQKPLDACDRTSRIAGRASANARTNVPRPCAIRRSS